MDATAFRYIVNFTVWIVIEEAFFTATLVRRPHFALRISAALLLMGCADVAASLSVGTLSMPIGIVFVLVFLLTVPALCFCFDATPIQVFFLCTASYAAQHLTYSAFNVILASSRMAGVPLTQVTPAYLALDYGLYAITGLTSYLVLVRPYKGIDLLDRTDLLLSVVLLVTLFVCLVLGAATNEMPSDDRVICDIYAIICCVLSLMLQFGILEEGRAQERERTLEKLLEVEQHRESISRETMEEIRRRGHDIRYRLSALQSAQGTPRYDKELSRLSDKVDVLDTLYRTGDDTLDAVLTEKGLLCRAKHISLSCIADGSLLAFMSSGDLYSLIGNALDNAIEAQDGVEEDKRAIMLRITQRGELFLVRVTNTMAGEAAFKDGLPVTTKSNAESHGFGTQNMRRIVEGYGGNLRMTGEDGLFNLTAVFHADALAKSSANGSA